MGINANVIQKLYIAYFNRPADVSGLAYWEAQLDQHKLTIEEIANSFSLQDEYHALYGYGYGGFIVIESIYKNLFGHYADPPGMAYWNYSVDSHQISIGKAALAIANGAVAGTNDANMLSNKILAASAFTSEINTQQKLAYYVSGNPAAFEAGRTYLLSVSANTETINKTLDRAGHYFVDFNPQLSSANAGFDTMLGLNMQGSYNKATSSDDTLLTTAANLTGSRIDLGPGKSDSIVVTKVIDGTFGIKTVTGLQSEPQVSFPALDAALGAEVLTLVAGSTVKLVLNNPLMTTVNLRAASIFESDSATALSVNGSPWRDIIYCGTGDDVINTGGGSGFDTVYGNSGNNIYNVSGSGGANIFGGSGTDTVNSSGVGPVQFKGGGGIDYLYLNQYGNFAVDGVCFNDGSTGRGIVNPMDRDVIAGFQSYFDIFYLDKDQTTATTQAGATGVQQWVTDAGSLTLSNAADITVLAYEFAGAKSVLANVLDGSALVANFGGGLRSAQAGNSGSGYILAFDDNITYLYAYSNATSTGVQAAEITLIASITGSLDYHFRELNVMMVA